MCFKALPAPNARDKVGLRAFLVIESIGKTVVVVVDKSANPPEEIQSQLGTPACSSYVRSLFGNRC